MPASAIHRELILPNPRGSNGERQHGPLGLAITSPHVSWLELHRRRDGSIRSYLGATSPWELNLTFSALQGSVPGACIGSETTCPIDPLYASAGLLLRALPQERSHYWPVRRAKDDDRAGTLVRTLAARELRGHELVLQVLFRRSRFWEFGFLGSSYETFLAQKAESADRTVLSIMHARKSEPPYHVEIRAGILGPQPEYSYGALHSWVGSWTSARGNPWWSLVPVKERDRGRFFTAFRDHDIARFHNRKSRRNVSAAELACVLPIPWRDHHPEVAYAGAPSGRVPLDLSAQTVGRGEVLIGSTGGAPVRLPEQWNHLAILGRTQTGKSSFALNLALQVLEKWSDARVVVMEPTGELIRSIVARIDPMHAMPAVEVDPAHPTFDREGTAMVAVPINPLAPTTNASADLIERERRQEVVVGGILQAFRCAWGAESIGGRAEFVLRAVLQGLLSTERSNLVDAYYLLSDKKALARFVRDVPSGPLRPFLENHLPRMDYAITISSLDKLGKIATNPLLRVALCQRTPVPFDRLLENRLVLLNLSKGALGADGANFLGAIYLSQLWGAVQRVGRPEKPLFLVVDEAQNYPIPVLAEMLSEGRKFGLHVVLVTQYLDRVSDGLRTALLGNVDTWAFFPLGAEDSGTAWRIANGQRHGWTPQDFAEGLTPRQFALVRSGTLLKVDAVPVRSPSLASHELAELVRSSSRRYARPEDSKASSWLVGQEEVEGLAQSLSKGPRTREELAESTPLPPETLGAALARSTGAGDVVRDASDGRFHLTARGSVHLRALQSRRNEGEEHVETLTELAMFLEARGIALSVPKQVAGVLMPDGQFHWGDAIYNVEVECSTLAKASDQVVRNVKKARSAGYRALIVLPDQIRVPRTLAVLEEAFPGLRLWTDGIGVLWKTGRGAFQPVRASGTTVWRFLDMGADAQHDTRVQELGESLPALVPTDPFRELVRAAISDLVSTGRFRVTTQEIFAVLPPVEQERRTDEQVGAALRGLGCPHTRVRSDGRRVRVYDLTPVVRPANGNPAGPPLANDPGGPGRWSIESPSEGGKAGPADRGGPAD
jgi:hypothetical protein